LLPSSHAQSPGVPVVLVLTKGGTSEAMLVGKSDTAVKLRPPGGAAGEYQIPFDQITEVRFTFPETVTQAQAAFSQGQFEQAAALLRPIVTPMLPYLDLPGNNALPIVFWFGDTLRRANKLDEALTVYDAVRTTAKAPDSTRGAVWAAHCHAALGRTDQALRVLDLAGQVKRDSDLFPLCQMVRAQARFAAKDTLAALDDVAQALAFARIESELYPDSLFLAAQCYEVLGATNAMSTRLVQLTIPGTNRTVAVAANTNVVFGLTGNTNYANVARSIYQEIVTKYPNSSAAQKSQPKLPPPSASATNKTEASTNN
jgi:tetratricopeptide (TPR) repeat protein